jgi:hypothetical protein
VIVDPASVPVPEVIITLHGRRRRWRRIRTVIDAARAATDA